MTWMVTGGAGYIGAHVMHAFMQAGQPVFALDDLSTGRQEFLPPDAELVVADICDTPTLTAVMRERAVTGVVHIAGYKYAGESVRHPLAAYRANVQGTMSVLAAMQEAGVRTIVFSSSASVYGTPDVELVTEAAALHPESPYGESKLIGEWLIADQARAVEGFRGVCLRYFNVVGSGSPTIWDVSPYNLFPAVMRRLSAGEVPAITGVDHPTPDGTCVRDYIHVSDLARTHLETAQRLAEGNELLPAYNLGSGTGASVRQMMDAFRRVTGIDFVPEEKPRREGDPARIVADGTAAARDLGWRIDHDVDAMVESAWRSWPKTDQG